MTKTIKVDGAFPDKADEVGKLLEAGWRIMDKTIIGERYIIYILRDTDPDVGTCSDS